jgi:gamma-glutamyl hercynylcysteine S-oxide hydrolase
VCRFLAYLGAPLSLAHLVFGGEHSLHEQSWAPGELLSGSVNADGYGVAWYRDGRAGRIGESRPIWRDAEELRGTLGVIESGCVVAALRNGTEGIPVDRSGLLPLVHDRWSFVLNGFVPDFRRSHMRALRTLLPDDLYAELKGSSDSETLFLLTLAALREGADVREALVRTLRLVTERVGRAEAQLNMLLSDGSSIAAVRSGTTLVTNSLYVAVRPPFAPDGVVIASEPPERGAAWSMVDGHSWIEVDGSGALRTEPLVLD